MASEKHIIKTVVMEVYLPSADDAFKMQNVASSFFKENIFPMLQKILDELDVKEEVIRIDKLELDFKEIYAERSNSEALLKFEQQVREKLTRIISETKATAFGGDVLSARKRMAKEKTTEELLLFVLKTGHLPWWANAETPIVTEQLIASVFEKPSVTFRQEFLYALKNKSVSRRLSKLSFLTIERILKSVASKPEDVLSVIKALSEFTNTVQLPGNFIQIIYAQAFAYIDKSEISIPAFVTGLIKEQSDFVLAEKLYLQSKPRSNSNTKICYEIKKGVAGTDQYFLGRIKKFFNPEDVREYFSSDTEKDKSNIKRQSETENELKEVQQEAVDKLKETERQLTEFDEKKEEVNNERLENVENETGHRELSDVVNDTGDHYVKNAGVIILTPYLPALFKELELSDGKSFNSPETAERAACILHFLSIGQESDFEEHDMVLNKIICGIEINTPFTQQIKLTEKEKEECSGLLQAVANNWKALKNTSGEAMRDGFFKRDGVLERQANGWDLKIEKTTIDILVDKLPWGISIIMMPWTNAKIFVNW